MPDASRPYRTRFVFAASFALLALLMCLLFLTADAPVAAFSSAQAPLLARNSHVPASSSAASRGSAPASFASPSPSFSTGLHASKLKSFNPVCGPDWQPVQSPNYGTDNHNELSAVAALSESDVWAVGYYREIAPSSYERTLIEHWDGTAWSVVPSPNVGSDENLLSGVAAVSESDVWAVGHYSVPAYQTLVEHWDGTTWSVVPSPNVEQIDRSLFAVAVVSANDVWAVGASDPPDSRTLVEHWDGTSWSIIPSPNLGSLGNALYGVVVLSADDVWAVGLHTIFLSPHTVERTLVEHWDGTAWSIVPSPNVGSSDNDLFAVAAVTPNDIWAVGRTHRHDTIYDTLTEHWDGTTWSVVPSPSIPDTSYNFLEGVTARGPSDVWAVGSYSDTDFIGRTLIEHWDGSAWSVVQSPNVGQSDNRLYGAAAWGNDIWAVGWYFPLGVTQTLVELYSPCLGTPTPTVTGTPPTATPTHTLSATTTQGTPTATSTPTATPNSPRCPGERFTDVCPGDPFYSYILALNDDGIVSGYNTSPPCPNSLWIPCFRPNAHTTRGQIAQIVSLAAGFNEPVSGQSFQDVPPGSTFYTYTERLAQRGIISGYPCGSIMTEPCVPPENRPYFRTYNDVTRGQLSKIVTTAFGWNEPVTGQQFEDVIPGSTFYEYIGRLYHRGIINGYPCGGPDEPCVPPANRPYFRATNKATRGQISKIVQLARTQPTPTPTFTPTLRPTPSASPTCCRGITGSVTSGCQGSNYSYMETLTSTCSVNRHGDGSLSFEVSPNQTGPWTLVYRIDYLNRTIPPGTSHNSGTIYTSPLPPGYNWWRTRLHLIPADGGLVCWLIDVASDPQPACVLPTVTPTATTLTRR